jgi:hypothetical protein
VVVEKSKATPRQSRLSFYRSMHSPRRLRFVETVSHIEFLLENTMDNRFFRGLHQFRPFESTASVPSLRAFEPLPAAVNDSMAGDDSGNVKVVVRVRQFIKRGMSIAHINTGSSWDRS